MDLTVPLQQYEVLVLPWRWPRDLICVVEVSRTCLVKLALSSLWSEARAVCRNESVIATKGETGNSTHELGDVLLSETIRVGEGRRGCDSGEALLCGEERGCAWRGVEV